MSVFIKLDSSTLKTIERLETKIDAIEIKIDKVVNLLDKLIEQNTKINRSTQNMDEHIHFVENVFDIVKYPFSSLLKLYYKHNKNEIQKDILDVPRHLSIADQKILDNEIQPDQ